MALTTIDVVIKGKLACGPCSSVILVLNDGTTEQELEGIILYEYANNPEPGYYKYNVQYDDDDVVVSVVNPCTVKELRCKNCCDELGFVLNSNTEGNGEDDTGFAALFTAQATKADAIVATGQEAVDPLIVSARLNDANTGTPGQSMGLELVIADDAAGLNAYTADRDAGMKNTGAFRPLKVRSPVPKGKFWALKIDIIPDADWYDDSQWQVTSFKFT